MTALTAVKLGVAERGFYIRVSLLEEALDVFRALRAGDLALKSSRGIFT
jgi:hypothetical protein